MDETVTLTGERVTLRPFREDEAEPWWRYREATGPMGAPGGVPTLERIRERVAASGRMAEGRLDLAIEVEGRLAGEIQTYRPPNREIPEDWFEIGIGVFDPADRGRGLGREAMALLADWLFAHGAARLQGGTTEDNAAMRRVFSILGFVEAGRETLAGIEYVIYALDRPADAGSGGASG